MKGQFGKRTGVKDMTTGVRHASSTYGKAANLGFSPKVSANIIFLLESEAEGLVSQGLSFAPDVIKFVPQGVAVNLVTGVLLYTREEREKHLKTYADDADQVIYTADFLIELVNGLQIAIEVKLDAFPGNDAYKLKLVSAAKVLQKHGCGFWKIVIPMSTLMPIWSNVPLIAQAHLRNDLIPNEQVIVVANQVLGNGPCKAKTLLHALGWGPNMLPVLVVNGIVNADLLGGNLKGDTRIELAHGDLSHLMLLQRLCQLN